MHVGYERLQTLAACKAMCTLSSDSTQVDGTDMSSLFPVPYAELLPER